jgi:hypothetical protein
MMYRDVARRLEALEQQAHPGCVGYAVQIDDGVDASVTVDGVDIPLAEYERRYPHAEVIDIGGPDDAA